ncbi:hypothetical protein vseg_007998 [Gypsophila vaccaria]
MLDTQNKRVIAKYIDKVYSNLPPTHSTLLTYHLKRLKNAGQLVIIKNSYQLPSFGPAATDGSATASPQFVKRRPGSPAKPKQPEVPAQAQQVQEQLVVTGSEKRGRGRPAKRLREQGEVAVPFV